MGPLQSGLLIADIAFMIEENFFFFPREKGVIPKASSVGRLSHSMGMNPRTKLKMEK